MSFLWVRKAGSAALGPRVRDAATHVSWACGAVDGGSSRRPRWPSSCMSGPEGAVAFMPPPPHLRLCLSAIHIPPASGGSVRDPRHVWARTGRSRPLPGMRCSSEPSRIVLMDNLWVYPRQGRLPSFLSSALWSRISCPWTPADRGQWVSARRCAVLFRCRALKCRLL